MFLCDLIHQLLMDPLNVRYICALKYPDPRENRDGPAENIRDTYLDDDRAGRPDRHAPHRPHRAAF